MEKNLNFKEVLDSIDGGDGRYTAHLSENWLQGRSAFGGLLVALAVRAARRQGVQRPLRSVLASFIGPVSGDCELKVRQLRQGSAVSQYDVEVHSDGQIACHVGLVFGQSRPSKSYQPLPVEPPEKEGMFKADFWPFNFLQNMEIYFRGDGLPGLGREDTSGGFWVRINEADSVKLGERLVALADMPPPIMMAHYDHVIRGASITWKLEILADWDEELPEHCWLEHKLEHAEDGYNVQSGRIYAADGRLLAIGNQCMAFFELKAS